VRLLVIVAYCAICAAILAALAFMVASAIARERRHRQRLRSYEAARRAIDTAHRQKVRDMLPGSAQDLGDLPSAWDPYLVDQPRTPRQGG
jgi:Flp pilus assembly protein TadB